MALDIAKHQAMAVDPEYHHIEGCRMDLPPGTLDDPEKFRGAWVSLPSGLMARFMRVGRWEKLSPPLSTAL
jgi:hypothetical protein